MQYVLKHFKGVQWLGPPGGCFLILPDSTLSLCSAIIGTVLG